MTDRQATVTRIGGDDRVENDDRIEGEKGDADRDDRAALRELLSEYHDWMADRAEAYDPAAELDGDLRSLERDPAGCVLLYGETEELAEFKRLYVRPTHREEGIGRRLVRAVIDRARAEGFETLGLTTPPWSETAHALYESMGFERTPPYPETRLPERHHEEAIFMRLGLTGDSV